MDVPQPTVVEPGPAPVADGPHVVVSDELRALFRASARYRERQGGAGAIPPTPDPADFDDPADLSKGATAPLAPVDERPATPARSPVPEPAGDPGREAANGASEAPAEANLAEVPPEPEHRTAGPVPAFALRLRRDGARPLVFQGAPLVERNIAVLLSGSTEPPDERQARLSLGLYVAEDGAVVAAARSELPDEGPGRSVYRAGPVASRAELDAFLAAFDPAAGWSWIAATHPPDSPEGAALAELSDRMARAFVRLCAAARRAAPAPILQTENGET